jgi:hypothetical protein
MLLVAEAGFRRRNKSAVGKYELSQDESLQ